MSLKIRPLTDKEKSYLRLLLLYGHYCVSPCAGEENYCEKCELRNICRELMSIIDTLNAKETKLQ